MYVKIPLPATVYEALAAEADRRAPERCRCPRPWEETDPACPWCLAYGALIEEEHARQDVQHPLHTFSMWLAEQPRLTVEAVVRIARARLGNLEK